MKELSQIEKNVIMAALDKMLKSDGWFSVSTINNILKITGGVPDPKDMDLLDALHCVNWKDMSRELRGQVVELVFKVVSSDELPVSVFAERYKSKFQLQDVN